MYTLLLRNVSRVICSYIILIRIYHAIDDNITHWQFFAHFLLSSCSVVGVVVVFECTQYYCYSTRDITRVTVPTVWEDSGRRCKVGGSRSSESPPRESVPKDHRLRRWAVKARWWIAAVYRVIRRRRIYLAVIEALAPPFITIYIYCIL